MASTAQTSSVWDGCAQHIGLSALKRACTKPGVGAANRCTVCTCLRHMLQVFVMPSRPWGCIQSPLLCVQQCFSYFLSTACRWDILPSKTHRRHSQGLASHAHTSSITQPQAKTGSNIRGSYMREVHAPNTLGVLFKGHGLSVLTDVPQLDDPLIVRADEVALNIAVPAYTAEL